MLYGGVNEDVLRHVPLRTKRLVDLGCGVGSMGKCLKDRIDCHVLRITFSADEARIAAKSLDEVLIADLDQFQFNQLGSFDCALCSHVLDHLRDPERVLVELRDHLAEDGVLIVALPNVLYWRQRWEFLWGRFRYTEGGLMDRTHCRFFDWRTAQDLIAGAGYVVEVVEATGGFPLSRWLGNAGRRVDSAVVRALPGLFGFQFLLVARPKGAPPRGQT